MSTAIGPPVCLSVCRSIWCWLINKIHSERNFCSKIKHLHPCNPGPHQQCRDVIDLRYKLGAMVAKAWFAYEIAHKRKQKTQRTKNSEDEWTLDWLTGMLLLFLDVNSDRQICAPAAKNL